MDSAHPPSLSQPTHPAPTNQGQKQGRASRFKGKLGRPSKRSIVGLKSYFNRCIRAGKLREARAFHAAHDLARYGIPSPPLPSSLAPLAPATLAATTGGEGVDQPHGRDNWDKTNQNGQNLQYGCTTTPAVQILQCSPVATAGVVPLAVEADLTRLAAKAVYTPTVTPPAGESEGDRGFGQAESRSGADQASPRYNYYHLSTDRIYTCNIFLCLLTPQFFALLIIRFHNEPLTMVKFHTHTESSGSDKLTKCYHL